MELTFSHMQQMQRALQEKYKDKWTQLSPQAGRSSVLWMMAEMGEVADIIKKRGDDAIVGDPQVRGHFVEELCDVLMYLSDVALCYGIEPEEIERAYFAKHERNMGRW